MGLINEDGTDDEVYKNTAVMPAWKLGLNICAALRQVD